METVDETNIYYMYDMNIEKIYEFIRLEKKYERRCWEFVDENGAQKKKYLLFREECRPEPVVVR